MKSNKSNSWHDYEELLKMYSEKELIGVGFNFFMEILNLTSNELEEILGRDKSSFETRLKSNLLTLDENMWYMNFSHFLLHGLDVFENKKDFQNWLKTINPALNFSTPIELIGTREGIEKIWKLLGEIQRGE